MDWKKYKKELLSKPGVKKEYEKLQTEFKLVSSIIETRLKKKMTQAEVAEKAALPQSTIARIEGFTHGTPKLRTLEKIAEALDSEIVIKLQPKKSKKSAA